MNREQALQVVLNNLSDNDVTVGTTGFLSRELEELRREIHINNCGVDTPQPFRDFLTVGSMGHSSSIALGISLFKSSRKVFCLDGDGACLMHMGALAQNASTANDNFFHLLFNNEAHDSVGAQPTYGAKVDFAMMAKGAGYKTVHSVSTAEELSAYLKKIYLQSGPHFLEVKIRPGARKDLARPKLSPLQAKEKFMDFLQL